MACTPKRQPLSIEIEQHSIYRHNLQIYNIPPSGDIKFEELLKWCVDRLRVLTIVEQISSQYRTRSTKKYVPILISELENNGMHDFANLVSTDNSQRRTKHLIRNDCTSHFMLRSAFSFENTHRRWFFTQETKLFKWRLSLLSADDTKRFMDMNGLQFSAISQEEKQEIQEDLRTCYAEIKDVEKTTFYKVHFTSVMKPVRKRQIFLKDGIAYVPETKLFWLILAEFKEILNQSFAGAREIVSYTYDERIRKILTLPEHVNTQKRNYGKYREVFANELDELSRISYPLCMKVLHEALRTKHHLTNGGRVQYGLYLKGIGLSLDNAIKFWKDELTKTVDERTFHKEYQYYIKHFYGQIGRCADYDPFPCSKIFNSTIGVRDDHGCPYKRMESHVLQNTLSKCGLVRSDIDAIVQHSKEGHYLEACKIYYEATNNSMIEKTFDHPNVYFAHSLRKIEIVCSDTED
ncbi:DNA primase large subunit-like isoform X2 [Lasioglossum baleicum]|uniref:DNA primase large subunit-like isoform X2 n=1 Tax=Lasioglossum baleicum TaxID=434251 RepID=UPI003FCC69F6